MPYLRDTVIVLRKEKYRERDALITMFGKELGKYVAIARGYESAKAKQFGHLEPLTVAEVMIAKGASIDTLAVAKSVRSSHRMRKSLVSLTLSSVVASIIDELTRLQHPDAALFFLLQEILEYPIDSDASVHPDRGRFVYTAILLKVLDAIGLIPRLDICIRCLLPIEANIWFSGKSGGLSCKTCAWQSRFDDRDQRTLDEGTMKILRFLQRCKTAEAFRLTITKQQLFETCFVVEEWLKQTPLKQEPHSISTLMGILR